MQHSAITITLSSFLLVLFLGTASTLPKDSQDIFIRDPDSSLEIYEELTANEGSVRRRRQTILDGTFNREILDGGIRRDIAKIGVSHTSNKHTIGGGVTVDRARIPGLGTHKNVGVQASYGFNPNKNTNINIGLSHSRGNAGRNTNFGIGFTHKFGKK